MIDLQQIRELDLETVEPGHFVELGNEVSRPYGQN